MEWRRREGEMKETDREGAMKRRKAKQRRV